ncbi:MAG: hypothetical protein Q7S58_19995 [Candidatus Binatus sp.]|uniref:hypothetical protein n=1 Tax=Candidatus Binatus sp. TaxID=2811406 RepID=UPI002721A70B|nr:hypothetical protein [Candidatus Binatus sp.]MDO8434686.1 hypothetical protein [Candidatus Binatus sp.]
MKNNERAAILPHGESGPLSNLTVVELRGLWRQLYGSEPQASINRSLLIKRIVARAQQTAGAVKSANSGLLARITGAVGTKS